MPNIVSDAKALQELMLWLSMSGMDSQHCCCQGIGIIQKLLDLSIPIQCDGVEWTCTVVLLSSQ